MGLMRSFNDQNGLMQSFEEQNGVVRNFNEGNGPNAECNTMVLCTLHNSDESLAGLFG